MPTARRPKRQLGDQFADLSDEAVVRLLDRMPDHELVAMRRTWEDWAVDAQLPPDGDWRVWLLMAGRGFGKTRAGAEWVAGLAEEGSAETRIALIGATRSDVRDIMIEGESGILSLVTGGRPPVWEPALGRLSWASGATGWVFSGSSPESLRGPQHSHAWCDELAKWTYPRETWDNLWLGLAATPAIGVFAAGASPGWRRASLLASADDGASFVAMGATALPSIIGATATLLEPGSTALVDRSNSVEVVLLNTGMTLADADTAALLAGANRAMIGNEMIQFGRAQPVLPGRWRLSELWRGRRGTEDAVVAHSAGAPFVLIEEAAVALVPSAHSVAGVHVMGAGIGDIEPYPQATCATAARAVMPLAPVHPTITALSSGDTVIAWTRRSRAGWAWRDGLEVPLGEEREAYGVVWAGGSAETVSPDFTYTTAMRAADVAFGATTAGFAIRQIGDGALSPPLSVTLTL